MLTSVAVIGNYQKVEDSSSEEEEEEEETDSDDNHVSYGDECENLLNNDLAEGIKRVQDFYRRVRKWFVPLFIVTLVCLTLLCISITIHLHYCRDCEPNDAFGKFGLGLLTFLVIRYAMDSGLAGLAWCISHKILTTHAHQRLSTIRETCIKQCTDDSDPGQCAIYHGADSKAARETIKMGAEIARHLELTSSINNLTLLNKGHTGVWANHKLRDEMMESLYMLKLDDSSDGGLKKVQNLHHRPGGHIIQVLVGVDGISLLTCLFFILMGTHVPSSAHLVQGSSWCQTSYAFNWATVAIMLLHGLFRLAPRAIRCLPFIRQQWTNLDSFRQPHKGRGAALIENKMSDVLDNHSHHVLIS